MRGHGLEVKNMHRLLFNVIFVIPVIILLIGCSSGTSPTSPDEGNLSTAISKSCHLPWGLWQFTADPINQILDVVQLRTGDMHLNALPFLEPPKLVYLTLGSVAFNGNIVDADIGLRHPFAGLIQFTGFDVCGILITNGSISGFDDPGLVMASEGDTRLLNPDGYSRWWNPSEFPVNDGTMFAYNDGLLGAPDSSADFNCTLNGYKYFCDALTDPDAPVSEIPVGSRGMFSVGQKNIRHYAIELGTDGLVFNYAVDANWVFPDGGPPWDAPDDFPSNANRPEAYRISISETENTLWNDGIDSGGDLCLSIDVYDWFNAGSNTVKVESSGNFTTAVSSIPNGGGTGYSTYEIDIIDATSSEGSIEYFVSVECEVTGYGGNIPGQPLTSYWFGTALVDDEAVECIVNLELKWVYDGLNDRIQSCPTIADIDGDGTSEIFIGDNIRDFYCFEHDGSVRWHVYLDSPVSFWYGSPAVEDFNGDDILDVVISNLDPSTPTPNRMYVLDGDDGSVIHSILSDNWQSYPSLADIGGPAGSPDGTYDIVLNEDDGSMRHVIVLDGTDFSEIWRYDKQGYSISIPVTADFNDDDIPDVVAISQSYTGYPDLGIHVLDGDENTLPANRLNWMNGSLQRIHDTPALHDWTGDGVPDIAVANNPSTGTRCLYVLDGTDGSVVWQYAVMAGISSPALGDLNGDDIPDIVVGEVWDNIYAFDGDPDATQRVLWNYHYDGSMGGNMDVRSMPMLCDVDCDNVPDVLVGVGFSIPGPYNPGKFLILNGIDGTLIDEIDFPTDGEEVIFGGPAVGDIDNDGMIDFVFGTFAEKLYCYTTNTPMPNPGTHDAPWLQYASNIHNTGLYGEWY